jgi:DNA-binding transcriptional MerR regulator
MDNQEKLLSIEEVSLQLEVPKHTLRFWEKILGGILVPNRTQGGQRRYSHKSVALLEEVKRLREKGKSLSEIKRELTQREMSEPSDTNKIDLLATRVAEVVKAEVYNFLRWGR